MNAPSLIVVETGILLVAFYSVTLLGTYVALRRFCTNIPLCLALCVPLTQAIHSLILQSSFLLQQETLFWIGEVILIAYAGRSLYKSATLWPDSKQLLNGAKRHWFFSIPLLFWTGYAFLQVLLMPIKNSDALTYHLPRVALFAQEYTFFPLSFNNLHQAVFPVGSDILFFPFWKWGTTSGMAIFNLTSYLSLGCATYAVARQFTNQYKSLLTTLILLGLSLPVLQSVSVKNDILMAAVGMACLALAMRPKALKASYALLLLALLVSFGVSSKTLFLAFLPGLFVVIFIRHRLYSRVVIASVFSDWKGSKRLVSACCVSTLILSNVWLFAYNHVTYGNWAGPESLTYRHQQHDGLKGTVANLVRYSFQIPQLGYLTDRLIAPSLDMRRLSTVMQEYYWDFLEPKLGDAGATREPFKIYWVQHEDFSWFGPMGTFVCFICLAVMLVRKPKSTWLLLPAIVYLIIVCAEISWMPWNSRFFTLFAFSLSPAVAVTLHEIQSRFLLQSLALITILSGSITKLFDFSRPAVALSRELRQGGSENAIEVLWNATFTQSNAWKSEERNVELHAGAPSTLLAAVPTGATVGIYTNGRQRTYGYLATRSDLKWVPLNFLSPNHESSAREAFMLFDKGVFDMDYILMVGCGEIKARHIETKFSEDKKSALVWKTKSEETP